jgi:pilus assembly protein FimV
LVFKSKQWQHHAMAAAVATLVGLWSTPTLALSLGRLTVESALGEAFRAQVDIAAISEEEAATLKTTVASPEAYKAVGLNYNPALPGVTIALQKRANGSYYFQLSSEQSINEPFIDLILEANWASGRLVRSYAMLFDPAKAKTPDAVEVTQAQITAPTTPATPATPAAPASAPAVTPAPLPAPATAAPPAPAKAAAPQSAESVKVKAGDTAGAIAASLKPANISLDQMLVAMLAANPNAFIQGNVNLLKAGATLSLPSAEQASATSAAQAQQIIVTQSKDFNALRAKLAGSAPLTAVDMADRQASGKVQAKIEEKKSAAPTPDKLTLSKGAVQSNAAEDKLAKERSAKETASRSAEIAKNLSDLNKLGLASSTPASGASAAAPAASAASPTLAMETPAPAKPAAANTGLMAQLIKNPMLSAGAGGLIALLLGLAFYRARQRNKELLEEHVFLNSIKPDPFEAEKSLADEPAFGPSAASPEAATQASASKTSFQEAVAGLDLNLNPDVNGDQAPVDRPALAASPLPDREEEATEATETTPGPTQTAVKLNFDFGDLSLDLDAPVAPTSSPASADLAAQEDPLATKLALAEEFSAIGDHEGARALMEEVLAQATGDLKTSAQAALDKLPAA